MLVAQPDPYLLVQTTQFKRSHKNVTRTQKELHTEQNAIVGRKPLTLICRLRALKPAECYSLASSGSEISANPEDANYNLLPFKPVLI